MKLNTLFVAGVCASTLLVSCNPIKTAKQKQLSNTHTSLMDGDAYQFVELVGAKAVYENDYAAYAEKVAVSAQAKQLAAKAQEVYGSIIPDLDSLVTAKQGDFPIIGAAKFVAPGVREASTVVDSSAVQQPEAVYSDAAYALHVQQEAAEVKNRVERMLHNTDADFRAFAKAHLEGVSALYAAAGGKEEAGEGHE